MAHIHHRKRAAVSCGLGSNVWICSALKKKILVSFTEELVRSKRLTSTTIVTFSTSKFFFLHVVSVTYVHGFAYVHADVGRHVLCH